MDDVGLCQVFRKVRDVRDIASLLETNNQFRRLASQCITRMGSKELIHVPFEWFLQFPNLISVGKTVLIQVTGFHPIMLQLKMAHFLFEGTEEGFISFLRDLNLERKTNYSISYLGGHISVDTRYNNLWLIPLSGATPEEVIRNYNLLLSIPHRFILVKQVRSFGGYVKHPLRMFLGYGDFGLINPLEPPSDTNLPLSTITKKIADSGFIYYNVFTNLMMIYLRYKRRDFSTDTHFRQLLNDLGVEMLDLDVPLSELPNHLRPLIVPLTEGVKLEDLLDIPYPRLILAPNQINEYSLIIERILFTYEALVDNYTGNPRPHPHGIVIEEGRTTFYTTEGELVPIWSGN